MSQVYPVFLWGLLPKAAGKDGWCKGAARDTGGQVVLLKSGWETHCSRRRSLRTPGPSLAGSSEIRMASSMAASNPEPPSPLRAGPKHSGFRMSSRTTTLAFSSTLSPGGSSGVRRPHEPRVPPQAALDPVPQGFMPRPCLLLRPGPWFKMWATRVRLWPVTPASHPTTATICLTVDEDSKAQEVQVALTATGVPADVWVPFG